MHCASKPSPSIRIFSPLRSNPLTAACLKRTISPTIPGTERQPSRSSTSSLARLDLRIDDDRRLVLVVVHVHHEEALGDVDLRCGQTDARRGVHRFEHVVDELLEERVADLFGRDSLGDFAQRRVAFG